MIAEGFERQRKLILICGLATSPRSGKLKFYFMLIMSTRACAGWVLKVARGIESSGAGIPGCYKLPEVSAGYRTLS